MTSQESHPLHALPTAQSTRLIDFDRANVISQLIYPPPPPTLVVDGIMPDPAMTVTLVPRAYIRQPEHWGIEVVGSVTGVGGQGMRAARPRSRGRPAGGGPRRAGPGARS